MIGRLLRIEQWYKNLVIFLPIVFGHQLMNGHALLLTVAGFFSLCFVSSTNYIINDILDRKEDRKHPEKRLRPIAHGQIKPWAALWIALLMLCLSWIIAALLSWQFLAFVVGLFALSQIYNFWLKREFLADVLVIGILFVMRAVSGAYVQTRGSDPYLWISPWLILCPFFLSLFLSVGKREADSLVVPKKPYNGNLSRTMMIISTTLLILSYSLYSFLSVSPHLLYTMPFALYVIFRYLFDVEQGSIIARHPEKAYTDRRLMIGILLWLVSVLVVLY